MLQNFVKTSSKSRNFWRNVAKFWDSSGAELWKSCRSWKMLNMPFYLQRSAPIQPRNMPLSLFWAKWVAEYISSLRQLDCMAKRCCNKLTEKKRQRKAISSYEVIRGSGSLCFVLCGSRRGMELLFPSNDIVRCISNRISMFFAITYRFLSCGQSSGRQTRCHLNRTQPNNWSSSFFISSSLCVLLLSQRPNLGSIIVDFFLNSVSISFFADLQFFFVFLRCS